MKIAILLAGLLILGFLSGVGAQTLMGYIEFRDGQFNFVSPASPTRVDFGNCSASDDDFGTCVWGIIANGTGVNFTANNLIITVIDNKTGSVGLPDNYFLNGYYVNLDVESLTVHTGTLNDIIVSNDMNTTNLNVSNDAQIYNATFTIGATSVTSFNTTSFIASGLEALIIADDSFAFVLDSNRNTGMFFDNTLNEVQIQLNGAKHWSYSVAGGNKGLMFLTPDASTGSACTSGEMYFDSTSTGAFCVCLNSVWVVVTGVSCS